MDKNKNVWLLPTVKPSRLFLKEKTLLLNNQYTLQEVFPKGKCQNIYITDSEKPKAGDWALGDFPDNPIGKVISKYGQEFTAQSLNGDKYGLAEYDSKKSSSQQMTNLLQMVFKLLMMSS
jgi:hypothetical protein